MVRRVLTFVYQEVKGLHQAAYILALFAFGSQILAVVRDRMLAHTFGAGVELDLYYAAFRIPDLLFVLFASVLSVYVLLPFVNRYTEQMTPQAGAAVLSQMFTLFLWTYITAVGILFVAAPALVPYIFPGFIENQSELVTLLRILLLQPFLLGLSSLCGVVTQMNHRFILYALSPLLYNIGIIVGIVLLFPLFGLSGLAWGVVLGSLGHLLVQVPFLRESDYSFCPVSKVDWKLMRKIFAVSLPRALTLSVNQIVLLIFVGMASMMAAGSVAVFQFAFNLQSVPLAIIGMSYSVAAFPTLSNLYAKHNQAGFNRQLLTAFRHIIFWSVPAIGLIVVLRAQVVRVLLGSGEFDWADTRLTAAMLAIFVVSLFAQALLLLLVRAFYAGGRTRIPLYVALASGTISVGLAFALRSWYGKSPEVQNFLVELLRLREVAGSEILVLPIAFVIGQFVQLVVLFTVSAKVFNISYRPLVRLSFEAVLAALAGGVSAYITLVFVVDGINQDTFIGIFLQGLVAGIVGMVAATLVYVAFGAKEVFEIARSFQSKILKTDIIAPQDDSSLN